MGEDQARVLRRALRKTLREEERFLSRKEERPAWKEAVEGTVSYTHLDKNGRK